MGNLIVDANKCLGCGLCVSLAGEYFTPDPQSGKSKVKKQPKQLTQSIKEAIASCPAEAIQWKEEK